MTLSRGRLDKRVTLYKAGIVKNEYGDPAPGFTFLKEVWASVELGPGRERLASAENAATAPKVFYIDCSSDIDGFNTKDRIEYPVDSGRMHEVHSVNEIGRRAGLEISATARAD